MMRMFNFLFLILFVTGCTSGQKQDSPSTGMYSYESNASPDSYGAEAMMIRRPMQGSAAKDWRATPFYFKKCNEVGDHFYYSKTSYECTYP